MSLGGSSDTALFLKASHVEHVGTSIHVSGHLMSTQGKECKLCDMSLASARIERVRNSNGDNLVLKHPGTKIAFGRPRCTPGFHVNPGIGKPWEGPLS